MSRTNRFVEAVSVLDELSALTVAGALAHLWVDGGELASRIEDALATMSAPHCSHGSHPVSFRRRGSHSRVRA